MPSGEYQIRVEAEGYLTEWYDDVYTAEEASSVTVNAPTNITDMDFIIGCDGVISSANFWVTSLQVYSTDENAIDDVPLDFRLGWSFYFKNTDQTQNVSHVTMTTDVSGIGAIVYTGPAATVVDSVYTWDFYDVPPQASKSSTILEVTMFNTAPGFASSRQVDKEIFTEPGTQTVTVTITPDQEFDNIAAYVECQGAGETELVSWEPVGPVIQVTSNPTPEQTYTYEFTLMVTPKSGPVRFVPVVLTQYDNQQSSNSYANTNTVTAEATDPLSRSHSGTATTCETVQSFSTRSL